MEAMAIRERLLVRQNSRLRVNSMIGVPSMRSDMDKYSDTLVCLEKKLKQMLLSSVISYALHCVVL